MRDDAISLARAIVSLICLYHGGMNLLVKVTLVAWTLVDGFSQNGVR